ncbi:MAG: DUF4861 family protein [Bacteroidales bacterium]|nr:DUF4861 family protein [Bacteroidales bacterium]
MYKTSSFFILFALLLCSCGTSPEIVLKVSNLSDQSRPDATLLLSRGEILRWIDIPSDLLPVLKDQKDEFVPCQLDDIDGDGKWDELFGLTDLDPSGQINITIAFVTRDNYPSFPIRTNLHLGDAKDGYQELTEADRLEGVSYHNYSDLTGAAFQMEGPAWENDRVGFRNYMDQRNGMDIFGKTTTEMVLRGVGIEGAPSYHEPGEWGMDVLKVGTSLGAGAVGYMYHDSIYRVGDNGSGRYEVEFQGSQRSRFKLTYADWKVDELSLDVTHHVEIVAGRHYYQGTVSYQGTNETLQLVPGIVNMKSDQLHVLKLNDQYTALFTHDTQSEDGSLLAMALVVPITYLASSGETRDEGEGITQTYYAALEAPPGEPVPYRFYALWEKEDPKWASLKEVSEYLKTEAERWTQSVVYANRQ